MNRRLSFITLPVIITFGLIACHSRPTAAPPNVKSAATALSFSPSDDATIRASDVNANYGASPVLEVDASSRKDALLRFEVAGVGSTPVENATLRLFVVDPSPSGGDFAEVTADSWQEASVTWNSAPPGDGSALGSLGSVAAGSWYELDVTPLVSGDGPVSIRISSAHSNGADYASKEHSSGNAPQLVVNQASSTDLSFDVERIGNTYQAVSRTTSASYSGSLKFVVERALDDLRTAGSGHIIFSAGDFDLGSDRFEIDNVNDVTFTGQGVGVTTVRNFSSEATDTEPFDAVRSDRLTIRDLTVSAGGPDRTTSDALDFDGGDDILIERVEVTDARGRGIVFDGKDAPSQTGGTAERNVVRDCVVTNVPRDGIQLLAADHNTVQNCHISNVGGEGIRIHKSGSSTAQPNKPSNDNLITGNLIENAAGNGIAVTGGDRNELRGNTLSNNGGDGIFIFTPTSALNCDDNIVDQNVASGHRYGLNINNSACHRTVVGDNDFANSTTAPIRDNGTDTVYTSSDSQAPSAPANLSASALGASQVDLSWEASSDNVGVTGYEILRDGNSLATLGAVTSYTDGAVQPDTTYAYQVRARDAAGNGSALSNLASATTSSATSLIFQAAEDAYIRQDQANSNFGASSSLRIDGSPVQDTLLKFLVTGTGGAVESATLRLYNTNSASLGGSFHQTASAWDEQSVTWATAPAAGTALGTLGAVQPGNWYELDVSVAVSQDGWVSFRISSSSANGAYYSSKEGGNAPELLVTTSGGGGGNTPPVADPQAASTAQDVPLNLSLTGFDGDGDCPLDFAITIPPTSGSLSPPSNSQCSSGSASAGLSYTPTPGFSGADSFQFTLSDPSGAGSSPATVSLTVAPDAGNELSFSPSHDAYVRADRATSTYGGATTLQADGSPVQDILLKFDVSGLGSAQVTRAVLRLYNVNSASLGGDFYQMTSAWDENTVTWASSPAAGAALGSLGSVQPGNWYELEVTSAVTGNGPVSFRVRSSSANGAYYSSKEDAGFAPELVISVQ